MKLGKVLVAGLAVTVFKAIVGMVFCGGIFSWVYKIEPINVWKAMDGPPGATFFVGCFVLSVILAFVYALINKGLPGKTKITKGIMYGLCVWAVGMLPGMYATYSFMTVATTVLVYWTVLGLIQTPIEGIIIALVYGE